MSSRHLALNSAAGSWESPDLVTRLAMTITL
jgi:hypothetical protein